MDDASLKVLQTGNDEECGKILLDFVKENAQTFAFPDSGLDKKQQLINEIFKLLRSSNSHNHCVCLQAIRILTRDKTGLDQLFTQEHINTLIYLAGLVIDGEEILEQSQHQNIPVIVEAQKCLCNLIYNCKSAQRICSMNGCVEGIMLRLRTYQDFQFPHEIKFFDMRMLFLLTALCAEIRPKLRNNLHGIIYLMEVLDLILKSNAERLLEQNLHHKKEGKKRYSRGSRKQKGNKSYPDAEQYVNPCLSEEEVDLACEVLKVLFNLTVNIDRYNLDEEEEAHFMRLVSILHDILLCDALTSDKKNELHSHTVNLLTNMPASSYEELLIPLTDIPGDKSNNKEYEYEGMSLEVIVVLLKFMENRLDKKIEIKEGLTPVLTCLCECARANRTIRKYLRLKVLPPLKDVMNRPEEGITLRNRLVKLMTSPMTDVKELVADFLFVLCKENVERLIKYTGYGNAAGLLANRGLMHGRQGNTRDYSSDSDDSDTEEYLRYKDRINPVLGCYEEPRPSPLEGMSEEQKEFEAMQLVNMMNKLARDGILQPMKVGDDGKPHPVDHVLELRE